jgi:hypothetical protein
MNTIKLFSYTLLFILIIIPACSKKEDKSIIGRWEPVYRPNNIGDILEFKPDSLYTQITEARVNYTYIYEGDTLISTSKDTFIKDNGKQETITIIDSASVTISEDILTLIRGKVGDQQMTVMKRLDSVYSGKEGIVGFWVWPHQSGKDAISEFHPDGKASVSVLIDRREGKYFVNDDSLTVMIPGTTLRDMPFEIMGDTLLFTDPKYSPLGRAFFRVKE